MHIKDDLGIQLIGVAGRSHAGKDTIADYLQSRYENFWTEHFADPLKRACAHAFGIDFDTFCREERKKQVNDYWHVTPRAIAQYVGSELFREQLSGLINTYDSNFWVRRLHGRLTGELLLSQSEFYHGDGEYTKGDVIVIADVRFQNEVDWILDQGGVCIHVLRPGGLVVVGGIQNHQSEGADQLDFHNQVYRVLNEKGIEELELAVDHAINYFIEGGVLNGLKLKPDAITEKDL